MKKNTIITFIFTLALLLSNLTVVFADDGIGEPSAAPDSKVVEAPAEPAQEAAPEAPAAEETASQPAAEDAAEAPAQESADEASSEEEAVEVPAVEEAEETAVEEQVTEQSAEEEAVGEPAEEEVAAEEPAEEAEAAEETAVEEQSTEQQAEAAAEEPAAEIAQEEAVEKPAEEAAAVEEESVADVVAALSENDVQIVDENGDPVAMASMEAEEMLQSKDPFFWDPTANSGAGAWVGYTVDGTGCPVNVECRDSLTDTPFQDAVDNAPDGSMIYVADGDYAEDVVVNTPNLSFSAFYSIEVPDANANITPIINSSGYVTLDKITLNVDFGTTNGVYANEVVVNGPGGWLEDGLALVNAGGTVEGDIKIANVGKTYKDGNNWQYSARDHHHPNSSFDYEWECGEPDKLIYPNRSPYRMILRNPYDKIITDYYDNRAADPPNKNGDERDYGLTGEQRIEDLLIAVNLAEDPNYGPTDPHTKWGRLKEERTYWYLLGDTGKGFTGNTASKVQQKAEADAIVLGDYSEYTQYWDVWFMEPKFERANREEPVSVSPSNTQLTFFVYDPRPIYGCIDPEALNYDPNATEQREEDVCEYPIDPPTTTTTTTTPGDPVFVAAVEEVLIPVTGADLGMQAIVPASGLLLVGISFLMKGWMDNKKK